MSQKKALITALIAGAGILGFSSFAAAEAPGFYLGAQAGYGWQSVNDPHLQSLLSTNLNSISSFSNSSNKSGFAGGAYAGYQWNDYWGTELGYLYFPNATYNSSVSGSVAAPPPHSNQPLSTVQSAEVKSKEQAIDLMVKGMVPFGSGFGGYGKLGAAYVQNQLSGSSTTSTVITNTPNVPAFISTGRNLSQSIHEIKPVAALGLTYDFNDALVADLSYTYLFGGAGTSNNNLGNNSNNVPRASMVALGLTYYFGAAETDDP